MGQREEALSEGHRMFSSSLVAQIQPGDKKSRSEVSTAILGGTVVAKVMKVALDGDLWRAQRYFGGRTPDVVMNWVLG